MFTAFVMSALWHLDPIQYALLKEVHEYRRRNFWSSIAWDALDDAMHYEGREIVFNLYSLPHWDEQDPHWSWAVIMYFGTFEEAYLEFIQLNLRVRFRPGDVIFFRGKDLLHSVMMWKGGERHFIINFTHDAMWRKAGKTCRSSKAHGWPGREDAPPGPRPM